MLGFPVVDWHQLSREDGILPWGNSAAILRVERYRRVKKA
jgi:hypothetical protein